MPIKYLKKSPKTSSTDDNKTKDIVQKLLNDLEKSRDHGCKELTKKFDAVQLVKLASEVLGGRGGGGRKDFAQAGGSHKDKIKEAFKILNDKIS